MTSTMFFSNKYEIEDLRYKEMMNKWNKYKNDIDSQTLLNQIEYTLGRDYYKHAIAWFKTFRNGEWYRDDLV